MEHLDRLYYERDSARRNDEIKLPILERVP